MTFTDPTADYPSSVVQDDDIGLLTNIRSDKLSAAVTETDTELPIDGDLSDVPDAGVVHVGSERIFYGSVNLIDGRLEQCQRGFDGTSGEKHSKGDGVSWNFVAFHFNKLLREVQAVQTEVGTSGSQGFLKSDGTVELSADWDAGPHQIRSETFHADVATGTAPFVIDSTTVVSNLNADLLDGQHASAFANASHTHTSGDVTDFNEAVDDRVDVLIQDGTGLAWTYDDGAGTLTGNVSLSPFSTDDLSEGSNLYYTDERVDDRVAALIVDGNGLSETYNDAAGSLTIDVNTGDGINITSDAVTLDPTVAGDGLTYTAGVVDVVAATGSNLVTNANDIDWTGVTVRKNTGGADVGTRPRLNFIEGGGITLAITDDGTSDEIDISISAEGVAAAGGWVDEGTYVRQDAVTDNVLIGTATDEGPGFLVQKSDVRWNNIDTATSSTSFDSSPLTFRGSGWDGLAAIDLDITVANRVDDAAQTYRLAFDDSGGVEFFTLEGDTRRVGINTSTPAVPLDVVGDIRTDSQIESTVATGTAPLIVASTTLVSNLNADLLDGKEETAFLLIDGTRALTGNWGVGGFDITNVGTLTANTSITVGGTSVVLETRAVNTATGLTGGGDLSTDRTIDYDINALTEEAVSGAEDYLIFYDFTTDSHKKVLVNDLPGGGGGGAPTNAQYVVMALDGTLTDERVLTAGTVTVTDGGAGGNVTLDVDESFSPTWTGNHTWQANLLMDKTGTATDANTEFPSYQVIFRASEWDGAAAQDRDWKVEAFPNGGDGRNFLRVLGPDGTVIAFLKDNGDVEIPSGNLVLTDNTPFIVANRLGTNQEMIGYDGGGALRVGNESGSVILEPNGVTTAFVRVGGTAYTIWHEGNDGTGSGLDADTLDGIEGSNFLRSDQNDTINGSLTIDSGGTTNAILSETGIDRSSGDPETFNIQNSGAGSMTLQQGGVAVVLESRTITSGGGLTGGGDLSADRTLDVGAGTGIVVNADDVAVDVAGDFTWTGTHTFDGTFILPDKTDPVVSRGELWLLDAGEVLRYFDDTDVSAVKREIVNLDSAQTLTNKSLGAGNELLANLDANSNKITNLGQGTASGEALHAGRTITTGAGLSGGGNLTQNRTLSWNGLRVEDNGTLVGTRRTINFIEGSGITLTITDDSVGSEVDVTIAASGVPGGSDGQLQYNNGGSFGGTSGLSWDDGNNEFSSNIPFGQNQAIEFVLEQLGSDPPSPVVGQMWYRTDLD